MLARYCGPGLLGLGVTALIAGFMAGMAGNVSAFATVWTYDLYRPFLRKNASDKHYVSMGRWCTHHRPGRQHRDGLSGDGFRQHYGLRAGVVRIFHRAAVRHCVVLGMMWKRVTRWGGFLGLLAGVSTSVGIFTMMKLDPHWVGVFCFSPLAQPLAQAMWQALWASVACVTVTVLVTLVTKPRPDAELRGLVYSLTDVPKEQHTSFLRRPFFWGMVALAIFVVLQIIFW